mmetsp:Transcript_14640/g.62787  ORF Transcript_14640/g.62787 Transcript_14640/m.62787 type:complete len:206 (-) Transcript_14640:261-878(-)
MSVAECCGCRKRRFLSSSPEKAVSSFASSRSARLTARRILFAANRWNLQSIKAFIESTSFCVRMPASCSAHRASTRKWHLTPTAKAQNHLITSSVSSGRRAPRLTMQSSHSALPRMAIVPQAVRQSQNRIAARLRRNTSMKPSAVKMSAYMRSNSLRSYRGCLRCSTCSYNAHHTAETHTHRSQGYAKFPMARSRSMNVVAVQSR